MRKPTIIHLRKVSSRISLCSPHMQIRDGFIRVYVISCLKKFILKIDFLTNVSPFTFTPRFYRWLYRIDCLQPFRIWTNRTVVFVDDVKSIGDYTAGWAVLKLSMWQDVFLRALLYICLNVSHTLPTFDFSDQGFIRSLYFHTSVLPVIWRSEPILLLSRCRPEPSASVTSNVVCMR